MQKYAERFDWGDEPLEKLSPVDNDDNEEWTIVRKRKRTSESTLVPSKIPKDPPETNNDSKKKRKRRNAQILPKLDSTDQK
jgi:hypothetical protein